MNFDSLNIDLDEQEMLVFNIFRMFRLEHAISKGAHPQMNSTSAREIRDLFIRYDPPILNRMAVAKNRGLLPPGAIMSLVSSNYITSSDLLWAGRLALNMRHDEFYKMITIDGLGYGVFLYVMSSIAHRIKINDILSSVAESALKNAPLNSEQAAEIFHNSLSKTRRRHT